MFCKKAGLKVGLFVLQNEWQSNILDKSYQIMFKILILGQIEADRCQKLIFEILLLSPPWRAVPLKLLFH